MNARGELHFVGVVEESGEDETKVHIFPEYRSGLKGIEDFSHLIILYWIHLRDNEEERRTLLVFPRKHAVNVEMGVFATRSPSRPNPVGLCVVRLLRIYDCTLSVKDLDALKGSPIIDIKPYIPRADSIPEAHVPEWTMRGPKT